MPVSFEYNINESIFDTITTVESQNDTPEP
jgi:hypothetical protein